MAVGAFIFIPAASTKTYAFFLIRLFSIGAGTALLQTAANPYITILGPKERAAQRISIMLGLPNSFVWAGIWPLPLDGLGRFTKVGFYSNYGAGWKYHNATCLRILQI